MANAKKKTQASKPKKAAAPKKMALSLVSNNTSFTLEDGVELPARIRTGGGTPYPFAAMAIGQRFFVGTQIDTSKYSSADEAAAAQREENERVANRLSGAVRRFTKKHEGFKFAVRTVTDPSAGVGVWRVEATA